ncbi:MAG TPA: hypothetical protein VHF87_16885 [Methylomirabilota bacterium]|nr:hypothetical protein [Methylomirabilota bacterium]
MPFRPGRRRARREFESALYFTALELPYVKRFGSAASCLPKARWADLQRTAHEVAFRRSLGRPRDPAQAARWTIRGRSIEQALAAVLIPWLGRLDRPCDRGARG